MENSEKRGGKFNLALPQFYLPLLLLMTAGYSLTPLSAGIDFWAHAAVGRWIVQHHHVPSHTLFLWSDRISWVWHSWLSQVIFYELLAHVSENTGGLLAMILTAFAAIFSLLIWWKIWLQHQVKSAAGATPGIIMALVFILAIYTAHSRFHPRPEIFSAVLLTVVLLILVRGITSWRSPLMLLITFALWANLHAGLAMGIALLGINALCNFAQDRSWNKSRWDLLALAAAIAGVFINPYGWHYWEALKPVASATFSYIDEWKPFWEKPVLDTPLVTCVFLCFAAALCAWLGSAQRRLAHLGWLLLAFISFLMARRNTWILAQIALAVIACNPQLFSAKSHLLKRNVVSSLCKFQPLARWGTCGCLLIIALQAQSTEFWSGRFVNPKVPSRAAQFLRNISAGHRIYNDYEISGYLEWKLGGNPPLFIDLLNAYHPQIMEQYVTILDGTAQTEAMLDKWRFGIIILPQPDTDGLPSRLIQWLYAQSRWQIIYDKDDALIWRKTSAP